MPFFDTFVKIVTSRKKTEVSSFCKIKVNSPCNLIHLSIFSYNTWESVNVFFRGGTTHLDTLQWTFTISTYDTVW